MTYENLAISLFNLLPSAPRMAHLIHADYQEEQGNLLLAAVIRQEIERLEDKNDGSGHGDGWSIGNGDGYGYGWGYGCGDGWGDGSGEGAGAGDGRGAGMGCGSGDGGGED